jgi:hypothetical protein
LNAPLMSVNGRHISIRPCIPRAKHRSKKRVMVGRETSTSSFAFRYRTGCTFHPKRAGRCVWLDEAEIIDQEQVAAIADALQTIVKVTEPAQIRKMERDPAKLLALSDLVELLLSEDFRNHIN